MIFVCKKHKVSLYNASIRLRDDKEVVLAAIEKNEHALEFASERLRDDKEVVSAATKKYKYVFKYASMRLKFEKFQTYVNLYKNQLIEMNNMFVIEHN